MKRDQTSQDLSKFNEKRPNIPRPSKFNEMIPTFTDLSKFNEKRPNIPRPKVSLMKRDQTLPDLNKFNENRPNIPRPK